MESSTPLIQSLTLLPTSSNNPNYSDIKIDNAHDAFAASLHLIIAHVSDFHKLMIRIISEKYKIPVEEIMSVITEHPDYANMYVNPTFTSLGLFTQEDVSKVIENKVIDDEPKKNKKITVKRKLVIIKKQ